MAANWTFSFLLHLPSLFRTGFVFISLIFNQYVTCSLEFIWSIHITHAPQPFKVFWLVRDWFLFSWNLLRPEHTLLIVFPQNLLFCEFVKCHMQLMTNEQTHYSCFVYDVHFIKTTESVFCWKVTFSILSYKILNGFFLVVLCKWPHQN